MHEDAESALLLGAFYSHMPTRFRRSLFKFEATYRMADMNGRPHMVVPAIPVQEQVLNYWLLPGDEINHFVGAWNGIPITIGHPKENAGSANHPTPDVPVVGRFYNASYDASKKQLKGEFWMDMQAMSSTDMGQRMEQNVRAGKMMEVSTGYWADEEMTSGKYNGRDYMAIQRNIRPDHIAVLMGGEEGACSNADGCGMPRINAALMQNERVHFNCDACHEFMAEWEQTMKANVLSAARTPAYSGKESTSWASVTKSFEAYRDGYYKATGSKPGKDGAPSSVKDAPAGMRSWIASKTLLGDPKADNNRDLIFFPVVNPSSNKLNEGALKAVLGGRGSSANIPEAAIKSAQTKARSLLQKEFGMAKKNTSIPLDNREALVAFLNANGIEVTVDEEGNQFNLVTNEADPGDQEEPGEDSAEGEELMTVLGAVAAKVGGPAKLAELLGNLPSIVAAQNSAAEKEKAAKAELIASLTANAKLPFSKADLEAMSLTQLQGVAKMAGMKPAPRGNFSVLGAGDPAKPATKKNQAKENDEAKEDEREVVEGHYPAPDLFKQMRTEAVAAKK